jgi:excisionase family DNA binding protein
MTVGEAANRIGISASKLYQLAAARRISHYRVDGKILFTEDDIAAFIQSCRVGTVVPVTAAPRVQLRLKHLTLSK